MARNQKLTRVLKGRTITDLSLGVTTATLRFDDGSVMTVQTAGSGGGGVGEGRVRAVRQRDTRLNLDFEGGGTLEFRTAEPTASVIVRDGRRRLEYAD